jgi:hypothetical protein
MRTKGKIIGKWFKYNRISTVVKDSNFSFTQRKSWKLANTGKFLCAIFKQKSREVVAFRIDDIFFCIKPKILTFRLQSPPFFIDVPLPFFLHI